MKATISTTGLAILALAAVACNNPVKDKPRAMVSEAMAEAPAPTGESPTSTLSFDQDGSKIEFVGSKVSLAHDGGFERFEGTVEVPGEGIEGSKVSVTIDMDSVWSDVDGLTAHLKKDDFFATQKHPESSFTSTKIVKAEGEDAYTVTGNLKLRGVEKQIVFPATITRSGDSLSVKAEFRLDRQDFGIAFPGMPDDLISDEVLVKLVVKAGS